MIFNKKESLYFSFRNYLFPFTRFWGVLTSVVLSGVGIDIFVRHHIMGLYIILGAGVVLLLEITWVISLFLKMCIRRTDCWVLKVWNAFLWVDLWKKSFIYILFSGALIWKPYRLWLSFVAGAMLTLLAFFYVLLSFPVKGQNTFKKESLLKNQEDFYERSGDIFEVLDNNVVAKEEIVPDEPGGNVLEI